MLATTTEAQNILLESALKQVEVLGSAVVNATLPVFGVAVNLDERLQTALLRITQLEAELEARKDNGR
jgi:hypothetical protein